MAKTQRKYLVGTLICSLISIAILIVSFATEDWVRADPELVGTKSAPSHVNYGLFFGTLERTSVFNSTESFRLSIACVFSDNICAYSCLPSPGDRVEEVEKLYETGTALFNCPAIKDSQHYKQESVGQAARDVHKEDSSRFINAGMWISTIIFLALSLFFSTLGCGFTIYNIFSNPIELYASIFGLYIWFTIAAVSDLMALILWGSEFSIRISSNIAILDTIVSYLTSKGKASLQSSYFILIAAECMHIFCIGLLYYRDRVLNKESKQRTIAVDSKADDNGLIY